VPSFSSVISRACHQRRSRVGLVPGLILEVALDVAVFEDATVPPEDDAAQQLQLVEFEVAQLLALERLLGEVNAFELLEGFGVLRRRRAGCEQRERQRRQRATEFCFGVRHGGTLLSARSSEKQLEFATL
jgi:hypothetical protein